MTYTKETLSARSFHREQINLAPSSSLLAGGLSGHVRVAAFLWARLLLWVGGGGGGGGASGPSRRRSKKCRQSRGYSHPKLCCLLVMQQQSSCNSLVSLGLNSMFQLSSQQECSFITTSQTRAPPAGGNDPCLDSFGAREFRENMSIKVQYHIN